MSTVKNIYEPTTSVWLDFLESILKMAFLKEHKVNLFKCTASLLYRSAILNTVAEMDIAVLILCMSLETGHWPPTGNWIKHHLLPPHFKSNLLNLTHENLQIPCVVTITYCQRFGHATCSKRAS